MSTKASLSMTSVFLGMVVFFMIVLGVGHVASRVFCSERAFKLGEGTENSVHCSSSQRMEQQPGGIILCRCPQ